MQHACRDMLSGGLQSEQASLVLSACGVAGGAAGLTLTVANAVFLMEPALNPGLEAQAAARIHRLGARADPATLRVTGFQDPFLPVTVRHIMHSMHVCGAINLLQAPATPSSHSSAACLRWRKLPCMPQC